MVQGKFLKKFICLSLFFIIVCSCGLADDIQYKQDELDRVQRQIAEQKALLERAKKKERSTLRDIYYLNRQVSRLRQNLNYTQQRLYSTESSLNEARQALYQAQLNYDQKQNVFRDRLQEIYKSQGLGYLYLFFSARSFSDLVNNSYYYGKIIENDLAEINNIKQSLSELEVKRRQLYHKKGEIENLKASIIQEKANYSSKVRQKQDTYESLKAQRREYEKNIEILLRNSQEIEQMIQKLMRERATGARGTGKFIWPARGRLTSFFGYRRHPIFKVVKYHTGIDIAVNTGTHAKAADSGVVIYSGWWGGYGNTVIIDHGRNYSTVYAHLSRSLVRNGAKVEKGQTIALTGSTGYSTGPHLHFEIRVNGRPVDPMKYL